MNAQTPPAHLPPLAPTSSSNIKGIGFHGGALFLQFGNRVYKYTGPKVQQHHADLLAAESMGKHFGANVRRCPDTQCELVHTFEEEGK